MTEAASAETPDKGLFARTIGIITSPGATFRTVVRYPRPASILLLICLVIGLTTGIPQFTARGRQMVLDAQVQQIEKFTGKPVTPEMYAGMERRAAYGPYITMGSVFIALPVFSMLIASVFWFVFNALLGGAATFKQVLAVVTHSQVIGALGALIGAPIQYMLENQNSAGPFNLGALAPMLESGSFGANFLGAISVFTIWQVIVSAIGLGVLYRRKTSGIAIGLLSAYAGLTALITFAISSFAGR